VIMGAGDASFDTIKISWGELALSREAKSAPLVDVEITRRL
jgi:hypothetical protein